MAPSLRKSTNLETLIPIVKAQIQLAYASVPNPAGGIALPPLIDATRIFTALASDGELMRRSPAAQFIAIKPLEFPIDERTVDGGGNDVLWTNGSWDITLFFRYGADVDFADDAYLLDPTNGILPAWTNLLNFLQLFDPVDANGVGFLAEPMRLSFRGWWNAPRAAGGIANWGRLKSSWEVSYLHHIAGFA